MLLKIILLKQVPALFSMFTVKTQTSRNARLTPSDVITLCIPAVKVESSRHSFAYWGAKLWNTIPINVRSSKSLSSFSHSYYTYLTSRLSDIVIYLILFNCFPLTSYLLYDSIPPTDEGINMITKEEKKKP